jgi:telomerase protein component 1
MQVGSLPAVLRKAMVSKFIDFDEYQLAKYNKENKNKNKKPKVSHFVFKLIKSVYQ